MLQSRKVLLTSRSRRLVLLLKATMGGDGNICLQRLACSRLSDSIVRTYFKKIRRALDLGNGAVAARKMSLPSPRAFHISFYWTTFQHYLGAWNRLAAIGWLRMFIFFRTVVETLGRAGLYVMTNRVRFELLFLVALLKMQPHYSQSQWKCDSIPGGGLALGYFLGWYVPPGTPNWHTVLKKFPLKLIPRSRNGPIFYTPF